MFKTHRKLLGYRRTLVKKTYVLTDLTEYYLTQILTVGCNVVHEINIFRILH
jgi:hypothetical protein